MRPSDRRPPALSYSSSRFSAYTEPPASQPAPPSRRAPAAPTATPPRRPTAAGTGWRPRTRRLRVAKMQIRMAAVIRNNESPARCIAQHLEHCFDHSTSTNRNHRVFLLFTPAWKLPEDKASLCIQGTEMLVEDEQVISTDASSPAVLPDGASAPAGQRISGGQRTGLLLPRRQ